MAIITGPLLGVFDTSAARLIGITQNGGTTDITYIAGQDTPTPAGVVPAVAEVNQVTGRVDLTAIGTNVLVANGLPQSVQEGDTVNVQSILLASAGSRVVFEQGETHVFYDQIVIPESTNVDLNGCTLRFETTGAKNNIVMSSGSSLENGKVVNAGSGFSGHGGNQCPIIIGDYGTGVGVSSVALRDLEITTARPNGNGILVTSDSNDIDIERIKFPDSDLIGRPILIHWGGANTPSAGTTHPHDIRIRDIRTGTLTNTDASASVVFISAAYDVTIDGINVEEVECMAGVVQTFAGDYGNYYASEVVAPRVMRGINISNVYAKKVRNTLLKVDNLSTLAPVNMVLPGPDFKNICGYSSSTSRPAVNITNCLGGKLHGNNDISGGVQAVLVGANVVGFDIEGGEYHDSVQFPVTVNNTTTPPEDCRVIGVRAYKGGSAGGSYGSILIGQSKRTICERNKCGATASETGVYGIRVDNVAVDSTVSRNHVYGVASGGVAYSMGATTTYGISKEFLDNTAVAGITFHGGMNPQVIQAYNRAGTTNRICIGSAAPTAGTWQRGDKVIFEAPTAGGYDGVRCVTSATPGTWKNYGAIEA